MFVSYQSRNLGVGQKGFTLIEIMVVIVILGLLAAIVAPSVMDRPDQAREIRVAQDVKGIELSLIHI